MALSRKKGLLTYFFLGVDFSHLLYKHFIFTPFLYVSNLIIMPLYYVNMKYDHINLGNSAGRGVLSGNETAD